MDINYSSCIKAMNHIGYTLYTNVCNGQTNKIPWGVDRWMEFVVVTPLVLLTAGATIFLLFAIIVSFIKKD